MNEEKGKLMFFRGFSLIQYIVIEVDYGLKFVEIFF